MRALILLSGLLCLGCPEPDWGPTVPSPEPMTPTPIPTPGPLTGDWVGLVSEDMGHVTTQVILRTGEGCINRYDWQGALTQLGNTLKGRMSVTFQGADCSLLDVPASAYPGSSIAIFDIVLSPPGGISIPSGDWGNPDGAPVPGLTYPLSGSYTNTTITISGQMSTRAETYSTTLRLRKR